MGNWHDPIRNSGKAGLSWRVNTQEVDNSFLTVLGGLRRIALVVSLGETTCWLLNHRVFKLVLYQLTHQLFCASVVVLWLELGVVLYNYLMFVVLTV